MNQRYKKLFSNIGFLTISNFASKILIFFLVPIYTAVLTTAEYGDFDVVKTTISLVIPILSVNIGEAVMRFTLDPENNQRTIISNGFLYILAAILFGAIFSICQYLFSFISILKGFELPVFLYFSFVLLESYMTQTAKGLNKVKIMGVIGLIETILMVALNLLFLLYFKLGLLGFYWANSIALASSSLLYFFLLKLWKYLEFGINKELNKKMVMYSLPLVLTAVGWTLNSSIDKYSVTFFLGNSANGLLAIAYKIPNVLDAVKTIFIQAWQISAVTEFDASDKVKFYSNMFLFVNFGISISAAILILLTNPLAMLLFKKDFYEAWAYVPLLIVSVTINSMAGYLGPILSAQYKSKSMALSAIFGIIINIIADIVLIQLFGVHGAIIATLLSSLVIFIVRRIAVGKMIDTKKEIIVYISWLLLVLMACIQIWVNLWYLVAIPLFIILLINSQSIKQVFARIRLKVKAKEDNIND